MWTLTPNDQLRVVTLGWFTGTPREYQVQFPNKYFARYGEQSKCQQASKRQQVLALRIGKHQNFDSDASTKDDCCANHEPEEIEDGWGDDRAAALLAIIKMCREQAYYPGGSD